MTGHGFVVAPSGWVARLPDDDRLRVESRWPGLSLSEVEAAFGRYVFLQDAFANQPRAGQLRHMVVSFAEQVTELRKTLAALQSNNLGDIIQQHAAAGSKGEWDFEVLDRLGRDLAVLKRTLPRTIDWLPTGRTLNARHLLTRDIVALLEKAGRAVDGRPNGDLCQIVGLLLHAAGEDPSNVVAIVEPVLSSLARD